LEEALEFAGEVADRDATALASEAGAASVEIQIDCDNNSAADDANNSIFFEARVTATASGPPRIRMLSQ
jgi:hypothetical protein